MTTATKPLDVRDRIRTTKTIRKRNRASRRKINCHAAGRTAVPNLVKQTTTTINRVIATPWAETLISTPIRAAQRVVVVRSTNLVDIRESIRPTKTVR